MTNPLLGQELSTEEIGAIKTCINTNPEFFKNPNYLEITNEMISLLRKNFKTHAPSIIQKKPNYSQLGPEIEKYTNFKH